MTMWTDQKILPFLWFDGNGAEAVQHYLSIFKDGRIIDTLHWGKTNPELAGKVLTQTFEIMGQRFVALNGGPQFKFTEAISFVVSTETQEETDYYWNKLTADGGQESACGWLKDKFGLSWQITPKRLMDLISSKDKATATRVMQAMMQMRKIDIPTLERAAAGK
jgi:predicted 3-demethylubiquinone-9 3-methyltransferase (glyoxalase superfamily)